MADDNTRMAAARRQRIQMLKKCIVLIVMTLIMLPIALCFILLERVQSMEKNLDSLIMQVEMLTNIVAEHTLQGQELLSPQDAAPTEQEEIYESEGFYDANRSQENSQPEKTDESQETAEEGVTAGHKVYLTFDDGPSKYTYDILDILDRYDVKATFFVVGKEKDTDKAAMQEIVKRGHTLGMHSYSHKYSEIYNSLEDFAEDYEKIRDYLYEVTGVESTVYRFPGGSSNSVSDIDMGEFADYLDTQGVRFFDWNISSGDGGKKLLSVEVLTENSTADIERFKTSVILMHDSASKSTTVEALPIIIETILALDDTVILPITEDTELVQHIQRRDEMPGE